MSARWQPGWTCGNPDHNPTKLIFLIYECRGATPNLGGNGEKLFQAAVLAAKAGPPFPSTSLHIDEKLCRQKEAEREMQ
ncbi:hypothetical protein PY650_22140 [Rhizobium calliandrae]|uniref:DUF982 domain-containing protein n=1 Tax=Rhizobium calliandrae TaxID=1312182 RepID=A0ABT7KI34_9HYPH|nr:hypothetical protein [Rhizobium calliandrae]MDL2408297.1 hypothetical protein [Rhizobium calliandrae]